MTILFENYERFIHENSDDLDTPGKALRLIGEESSFRGYIDSLTEGLSPEQKSVVIAVADRQRQQVLHEASGSAGNFAMGFTVSSFPILIDIYAEPIISELCTVYPTTSPIISIPRIKIKAQTRSYDGQSVNETYMPTAIELVRAGAVEVSVPAAASLNVFATVGLPEDKLKMNRRYTILTKLVVKETKVDNTTANIDVNVLFRPDNRNQLLGDFEFKDSTNAIITGKITGNIDYDKGLISYHVTFSGTSTSDFVCDHAVFSLRFVPVGTMNGRTKVRIETSLTDLTIDPETVGAYLQ